MSTTVIAIKGKIGNTSYYLMTMKAQELVKLVRFPTNADWLKSTIEERYQREPNLVRIRGQIVPYFREAKDRFIGSIIVASDGWNKGENFESLEKIIANEIPKAYRGLTDNIGYYTFEGNENLFILDGQHRVKGLELAMIENAEENANVGNNEVSNDEISVILIKFEREKARKIFTKINSYAKPPSKGQTLITNDDDIVAIIARGIANKKIIDINLVSINKSNLNKNSKYFIPLQTIAEGTELILMNGGFPFKKSDRKNLPTPQKIKSYTDYAERQWRYLLNNFDKWREALSSDSNKYRAELLESYLCNRPASMKSIIEIFSKVTNQHQPLQPDEAIKRLNELPWETNHILWDRLLIAGGKILNKNYGVATDLLLYIVNDYKTIDKNGKVKLLEKYQRLFPEDERESVNLDEWLKKRVKHRAPK